MGKWKPMERAEALPLHPTRRRELIRFGTENGYSEEQIDHLIHEAITAETWTNDTYVATIKSTTPLLDGWPAMKHMQIRRQDRKAIHDWRHLQQIKTDIFGPEAEAAELYPSERRVVDTVNSYHLWVLEDGQSFPFGFPTGLRSDENMANIANQQRPGAARDR